MREVSSSAELSTELTDDDDDDEDHHADAYGPHLQRNVQVTFHKERLPDCRASYVTLVTERAVRCTI